MFKVVFALHGEKRQGWVNRGILVIHMSLPSRVICLEASLITFFPAREAGLAILKLAAVIFAAGGFTTAAEGCSGCFWK